MTVARHRSILRTLPFLIVLCLLAAPARAQYGGGTGEPNDPYLIYTAEQLNAIGADVNDWDKHFQLAADVNLAAYTGEQFNLIGTMREKFVGTFDGAGHTIANFTYATGDASFIGLFSQVGDGALIKDVTLDNAAIEVGRGSSVGGLVGFNWRGVINGCGVSGSMVAGDNTMNLGALVGFNSWGTVSDCRASGTVTGGSSAGSVGGLVGNNAHGEIQNCRAATTVSGGAGSHDIGGLVGYSEAGTVSGSFASGDVSGDTSLGGLVGYKNDGDITQCYASGAVSGNTRLGGLVGRNDSGTIEDCYATGAVEGTDAVGGLVGRNHKGSVSHCYAAGTVAGTSRAGGLIGNEDRGTYLACFWDSDANPTLTGAGDAEPDPADIVAQTTAEMQTAATFLTAGWDFAEETTNGTEDLWKTVEAQIYPLLSWQKYGSGAGEPNDPYLIYTAEHLNALGAEPNDWSKHFKLMADIDLDPNLPGRKAFDKALIGPDLDDTKEDFEGIPFAGEFDGNRHRLFNLTIDTLGNDKNYLGLFGSVAVSGVILNLGLENVTVIGSGNRMYYPSVEFAGCFAGLCGENSGYIHHCWVNGSVTGGNYSEDIGGLCGWNRSQGRIARCYVIGRTQGGANSGGIGGICGSNDGIIDNCWASSVVTGRNSLGGLCGYLDGGSIENSYSTGLVRGTAEYVGGLCGEIDNGTFSNCFWDRETSGQTTSAGGKSLTTSEMQDANTFLDAGWDFVCEAVNGVEDVWYMPEGDYPRLVWELAEVPPCPAVVLELDATSFGEVIAQGVVLVDFFATWCSACHTQAPILDEVAAQVGGTAKVAKLDIDQARSVAQAYGVTAIPTLILFKNGNEFERFVGVTQAPVLVAAIREAIAHQEAPPRMAAAY